MVFVPRLAMPVWTVFPKFNLVLEYLCYSFAGRSEQDLAGFLGSVFAALRTHQSRKSSRAASRLRDRSRVASVRCSPDQKRSFWMKASRLSRSVFVMNYPVGREKGIDDARVDGG